MDPTHADGQERFGGPAKGFSRAHSFERVGGSSLSAPPSCPRCGFQNQPGYQFCTNCGASLMGAPSAPPSPPGYPPASYPAGTGAVMYPTPTPYPQSPAPYPGSYEFERARGVDRTKTGALLLLIGSLISWIPFVAVIGYLLILIGAILVILGRKAFGTQHARNVVVSIVLFIVGILVVLGVAVAALISNLAGSIGPGGSVVLTPALQAAALSAGLLGGIVAAFVIGIAELLFTYGLQAQPGRILLWAAYGANVALSFAMFLLLSPLASSVVTQADYATLAALQGTYALLGAVPALLFAAADYLAYSRINRGEIPARAGMPPAYAYPSPPASPPMPPQAPPPSGPAPPINPR